MVLYILIDVIRRFKYFLKIRREFFEPLGSLDESAKIIITFDGINKCNDLRIQNGGYHG